MKKVLFVVMLLLFARESRAQTWDNFLHPRPTVAAAAPTVPTPAVTWEFKPTVTVSATMIRSRPVGQWAQWEFLNAAGPGLTCQHTSLAPDGSNYADFSGSLVLLLTGNTQIVPAITPAVALMGGAFNNLLEAGFGYDLVPRTDGAGRVFFLISLGVNLTNN